MNDFSNDFENFIKLVDSINPGGGTALYDCMNTAIDSLIEIRKKYPKIIPRIIALTGKKYYLILILFKKKIIKMVKTINHCISQII